MDNIGSRIKRLREAKNYTQEFMANNLNVSQNTYSRIESESVKLSTERLKQIAQILDVPPEFIISNEAPSFSVNNSSVDKYYAFINNLQEDQKELYQSSIRILEEQLKHLQKENAQLIEIINKIKK
jgi:transcriptional regulator with XRE-family HTH domain